MKNILDCCFAIRPPSVIRSIVLALAACTNAVGASDANYAEAERRFQQHCLSAGERIKKTVRNVDGIFLIKLRLGHNFDEQFVLDDPYGRDLQGEAYIQTFLREFHILARTPPTHPPGDKMVEGGQTGYRFVEAIDPKDGIRYRYTAHFEQPGLTQPNFVKDYWRLVLDAVAATGPRPRYGVTFEDISTQEDRKYWIAGSRLAVIDLKANEVIAERIGYMMDTGQGNTNGGRSPWLLAAAHACPGFGTPHPEARQRHQTIRFVEKVLQPSPAGRASSR